MRYFSALCARMYRFSANSRATISSTAIFLSQQSRQYRSSPRGSDTSLAPHRAQRAWTTVFRDMRAIVLRHRRSDVLWRASPQHRRVHLVRVLLHHPSRAEARRDRENRLADDREPSARNSLGVAVVEGRHDLTFEQLVERFCISRVHAVVVGVLRVTFDEPAVLSGVPF